MNVRPIIFTAPMVRAILDGRKSQTRRMVKPQPSYLYAMSGGTRGGPGPHQARYDDATTKMIRCPYGAPGDRLWVRETWADVHPLQSEGRYSQPGRAGIPGPPPVAYRIIYRADGEYPRIHFQKGDTRHPFRELCMPGCARDHTHPEEAWNGWESSIVMPRGASRITLEVTAVRVERVQDIDDAGAQAEGIRPYLSGGYHWRDHGPGDLNEWDQLGFRSMTDAYGALWESLHGRDAWNANPWVWMIEFKRIDHAAA